MTPRNRMLRAVSATALVACALLLTACGKPAPPAAPPAPTEVTADAVGHFCGMLLVDHEGPKGQAFLAGRQQPLWFSSVRDTIAFLRMPAEARDVAAVYVNDMGKSENWSRPEPGAWVDPRVAWFVVDSAVSGGMGAPEAVPFSDESAAELFMQKNGGKVLQLADIADDYVLGPVELPSPKGQPEHAPAPADAARSAHSGHQ